MTDPTGLDQRWFDVVDASTRRTGWLLVRGVAVRLVERAAAQPRLPPLLVADHDDEVRVPQPV